MTAIKKHKKTNKSVSDSTLNKYWRLAVIANCKRDPVTGNSNIEELECHHIVPRKHFLLRWDYRNGVPLEKATHTGHLGVHRNIATRRRIEEVVDLEYLEKMSRYTKKEYFIEHGINDNEFREMKLKELKAIIERFDK